MILPAYFRLLKMSSFLRQLRKFGFKRLSTGLDKGAYYHEQFLRGMRFLCHRTSRISVIGSLDCSGNEPNFYDMPPAPLEPPPPSKTDTEEMIDTAITKRDSQANGNCRNQISARSMSFSLKLHALLEKVEAEGRDDILCWLPHGRSFIIRDRDALVDELIPKNFRLTKYVIMKLFISSVVLTADCSNPLNFPQNLDFRHFNANSAYTTSSESSQGQTRAPIIMNTSKEERHNCVNVWSEQQSLTRCFVHPSSTRSPTFTVSSHHLARF
jgi:HSF-type DNA-binding